MYRNSKYHRTNVTTNNILFFLIFLNYICWRLKTSQKNQNIMKKILLTPLILFAFFCNSYGQNSQNYLKIAIEKYNLKDYKGAIPYCNEAIASNPKEGEAYYYRGNSKYELKDTTGACIDLRKALELGYKKADEIILKSCH